MATIKDVAKRAGVSISTASLALNGKKPVSQETRRRVAEAARALQYRPNAIARSLVTRRTRTVGLVLPDITDPYFHEVAKGAESVFSAAGYTMILADTDRSAKKERRSLEALSSQQVEGMIVAGSDLGGDADLRWLREAGVDVVLVGRASADFPSVWVDNVAVGRAVTERLLSRGCRRIAYIDGPATLSVTRERRQGFAAALQAGGIAVEESLVVAADFTPSGGYKAARTLIDRLVQGAGAAQVREGRSEGRDEGTDEGRDEGRGRNLERSGFPQGIVAANDQMAIGAIKALRESGLRVPEDVALAGIGDIPTAVYVDPPLTTVALPIREMGERAAQILLATLQGGVVDNQSCQMGFKLMARASA